MKKSLRLLALFLSLATLGFWGAKGAHTGWSQDRVPVKQVDEVTGLDHITYEDRYVAGLDFLGGGLALAGLLAGVSLFVRNQTKSTA